MRGTWFFLVACASQSAEAINLDTIPEGLCFHIYNDQPYKDASFLAARKDGKAIEIVTSASAEHFKWKFSRKSGRAMIENCDASDGKTILSPQKEGSTTIEVRTWTPQDDPNEFWHVESWSDDTFGFNLRTDLNSDSSGRRRRASGKQYLSSKKDGTAVALDYAGGYDAHLHWNIMPASCQVLAGFWPGTDIYAAWAPVTPPIIADKEVHGLVHGTHFKFDADVQFDWKESIRFSIGAGLRIGSMGAKVGAKAKISAEVAGHFKVEEEVWDFKQLSRTFGSKFQNKYVWQWVIYSKDSCSSDYTETRTQNIAVTDTAYHAPCCNPDGFKATDDVYQLTCHTSADVYNDTTYPEHWGCRGTGSSGEAELTV